MTRVKAGIEPRTHHVILTSMYTSTVCTETKRTYNKLSVIDGSRNFWKGGGGGVEASYDYFRPPLGPERGWGWVGFAALKIAQNDIFWGKIFRLKVGGGCNPRNPPLNPPMISAWSGPHSFYHASANLRWPFICIGTGSQLYFLDVLLTYDVPKGNYFHPTFHISCTHNMWIENRNCQKQGIDFSKKSWLKIKQN